MKTLDEILSDIATMRDELASININPGEFRSINAQINLIEKDLNEINNLQKKESEIPENLLESVRWINMQERDYFVGTSHTDIGDFKKALKLGLQYHITQLMYDDGNDYEWLLGGYLEKLYWEIKDKVGEGYQVDICAAILNRALEKAKKELPDSLALQNAYVYANCLASSIQLKTSADYDNINDEIKQIIEDKGVEWFKEKVSDVSKAVLINDFEIDVDKLIENIEQLDFNSQIIESTESLFDDMLGKPRPLDNDGFIKFVEPTPSLASEFGDEDKYKSLVKEVDDKFNSLKQEAKELGGVNQEFYDDITIIRNAFVNGLNAIYIGVGNVANADILRELCLNKMSSIENDLKNNEYAKEPSHTRRQR